MHGSMNISRHIRVLRTKKKININLQGAKIYHILLINMKNIIIYVGFVTIKCPILNPDLKF